jgi:hypothetical protein
MLSEFFGTLHALMTNIFDGKDLFYERTIQGKCIVTANLLFSQASYQTPQLDNARGMMEISVQNRSAVSKTYDDLSGDNRESFLNTFEHISKDHKPNKQIQGAGDGTSSKSSASNSGDKFDPASRPANGLETGISETTKQPEEDLDIGESQNPPVLNLSEVSSMLEKLGINDSAEGSSSSDNVEGIFGKAEGLAALEMLNGRVGQNNPMPSAEVKAELYQLRQFITNALAGITSSNNGGNPLDGLCGNRAADVANLDQLMKGIISDPQGQKGGCDGVYMGADDSGEKPSDTIAKISGMVAELTKNIRETESSRSAKSSARPSQLENSDRTGAIKLTNESLPVSKMINDGLLVKENHMKMDAALSDETGLKIAKIDTVTSDYGLLNSQNQSAEKAFEAVSFSKQTEVGHENLRTQTLEQIVKRAVIQVKNGQHEAKIDLKPDFLGHVRMQVTTVNHLVTVKILTEFSTVKDMIENNIHQLKADLQQQGLNVDKLEVLVSHDSDKYEDPRQKADRDKERLRKVDHKSPENPKIETGEQTGNSSLRMAGGSTVDYFA